MQEASPVNFKLMLASLALAAIVAFSAVPASAQNVGKDTPGNLQVLEDGKECFDAAADKEGVTCTVLYGHIFDLLNRVPINVQFPPECAQDLARGFTAFPTVEPVYDFNQLTFYSSPGFVEYGVGACDEPRLHQERGLSYDVAITGTDIPITGYFYLSADTDEYSMLGGDGLFPGPTNVDTGAMPCLTVKMTLWTGAAPGAGDVIAEGQVTKTIVNSAVAPEQATPLPDPCPGAENGPPIEINKVAEFKVPLGDPKMDIPRIAAFVVHVEWWQHAVSDDQKVAQREWNVHTGREYRTRIVVPLANPVKVEVVRPQFFDGNIYVHTSFNSPWGSYDVDPDSIRVQVFDGNGQEVALKNLKSPILRYSVDHDGHFKPVNATFPWEFQKENLQPGEYTIKVSAQNWQHTASASKEAKVKIGQNVRDLQTIDDTGQQVKKIDRSGKEITGDLQDAPGAAVGTLLAFLAVAFAAMRRRNE